MKTIYSDKCREIKQAKKRTFLFCNRWMDKYTLDGCKTILVKKIKNEEFDEILEGGEVTEYTRSQLI